MTDLKQFSGKTAVITGAASGIGKTLAKGFASIGMRVGIQDIDEAAAQETVAEIGTDKAFPLIFDVSDREAVTQAASDFEHEDLSVLWLNAGVGAASGILKANPRTIDWVFSVNVFGLIWTAQSFFPLMLKADGPRHLGMTASSACLRAPHGAFPLYATTKHCTLAVAEAIADEARQDDISSTILCPGLLNTEIWNSARARPDRFGGAVEADESIAGYWRQAHAPDILWPHVAAAISNNDPYLVCATDQGSSAEAFAERTNAIAASIIEIE